jgi:uncharacterized membrane protein
MIIKEVVSFLGYALELAGVAIIIVGAATAIARYGYRHVISSGGRRFLEFRETMGRAMLIGLDFLVAGDIIRTVIVDHTLDAILGLGLVVLIRTILAFTIHVEVEGHWPWQSGGPREVDPPG